MDDEIDCVIIANSEYSSESKYMEEYVKTHYTEYFIIDGKVMKYDSNKQDLIESSDDNNVLTSFNIAKDIIETE